MITTPFIGLLILYEDSYKFMIKRIAYPIRIDTFMPSSPIGNRRTKKRADAFCLLFFMKRKKWRSSTKENRISPKNTYVY
ncbi:hypothetical protein AMS59_15280 [Lysinibacillus sp. FJAT-14745]|nr:hypothetical protein AMS59_15280 [Lysinibacillus sp. FJAT-14745]